MHHTYQEEVREVAVEGHWSAGGSENWYDKGDLVDNKDAFVGMVRSLAHNGRECGIQCPHTCAYDMELAEDVAREEIACQSRARVQGHTRIEKVFPSQSRHTHTHTHTRYYDEDMSCMAASLEVEAV